MDIEAEGRAIRASNTRESRYWRKMIWGCDECGMQGQRHHPACSMATDLDRHAFDTLEEDRGGTMMWEVRYTDKDGNELLGGYRRPWRPSLRQAKRRAPRGVWCIGRIGPNRRER